MFEYWYIERDLLDLDVEADPYLASRSSLPTFLPPVGTSAINASNSEIPKKMNIPIAKYSSWRVSMNIPTKITKGIIRISSINGGRIYKEKKKKPLVSDGAFIFTIITTEAKKHREAEPTAATTQTKTTTTTTTTKLHGLRQNWE